VPHLEPLRGHRVLDVGCGNGYFGWRMLQAGASEVIGVDPNPLFCLQHQAVNQYVRSEHNHVLPLRFEDLNGAEATFDSVFSMGVVYHRHEPAEHVEQLFSHVRPGGQIVLESLVVREQRPLIPEGRYARMRNVRIVPTPELMQHWLESAGFREVRLADVTVTGRDEQRTTPWMPFESLAEALDEDDPSRTVEGHPAPVRAVVIARKPVQSIPPPPTGQPLT
jgi:tRNA (mo5U34)-methyltransferase